MNRSYKTVEKYAIWFENHTSGTAGWVTRETVINDDSVELRAITDNGQLSMKSLNSVVSFYSKQSIRNYRARLRTAITKFNDDHINVELTIRPIMVPGEDTIMDWLSSMSLSYELSEDRGDVWVEYDLN